MEIRPYCGADEAALLALWNATLTHDRISASTFRIRVLLDPNFSPEGLLLAEDRGRLAGFVLSLARRVPLYVVWRSADASTGQQTYLIDGRGRTPLGRVGSGGMVFEGAIPGRSAWVIEVDGL